MSQVVYRANLSAKSFPFLSENSGRSVIVPGQDNNFSRQLSSPEDQDKDIGIPQIYYAHNVLPTSVGFQSVAFNDIIAPVGGNNFIAQYLLRDGNDNKAYLGVTDIGKFFINTGSGWVYKATYATGFNLISTAYVSGTTYIWLPQFGCLKYDFGTNAFVGVTLTAVNIATTLGICASYGYLLTWTISAIAWSSTIDPTDFTPSLVTGAGGGSVEGVKGAINFIVPHTLGFIIYTTSNTVAATYSGNSRYPFNFREIVNSGGVASDNYVSYDSNSGNHYAYTTSGLQLISTSQSQTIFPEVTDFLSGQLFEDFDENTRTFTQTFISTPMQKRLTMVCDRYLVISYGISSLTHALIFDLSQKRWGKIRLPHVECFEFVLPNPGVFEQAKQSFAFLQADGTVQIVNFSVNATEGSGVAIFGKYQYVRSRFLQLDQIDLENVHTANFSLWNLSSDNGKTGTWNQYYDASVPGELCKTYLGRDIGLNHSILVSGTFNLASIVLTFNIDGRR